MLCSGEELCLSDDSEGIIELGDLYEIGKNFGSYLERTIFLR